jgi:hypothetical protein
MGGEAAGPVDRADHEHAPWEKRVDALLRLLADRKRRIMTVDELRRGIEALGPGAYDQMTYYQRWMASIEARWRVEGWSGEGQPPGSGDA